MSIRDSSEARHPGAKFRRLVVGAAALLCLAGACGPPESQTRARFSMLETISQLNQNNQGISARPWRLSGAGRWSGEFVDQGGRRHRVRNKGFKLSAVHPDRVSFKAAHLPETNRAFEVGCNEDVGWFWLQFDADELRIAERSMLQQLSAKELPVRPDALVEALGVQLIDPHTTGTAGPRIRVVEDYHQLLFEEVLPNGQFFILKEYWLSRYPPYLVQRVLYRDLNGRVIMQADLKDYQQLDNDPTLVARRLKIHWPVRDWKLELTFERLKRYEDIEHRSFIQPLERVLVDPRLVPPAKVIWLQDPGSSTAQLMP